MLYILLIQSVNSMKKYKELIEKLHDISVVKDISITPDTEVYYDLRIYGDDFDELYDWIESKYGADFDHMTGRYIPGEVEIYPLILRLFGFRPYDSLTVGDLIKAIERAN
jgi:hypothetical protein